MKILHLIDSCEFGGSTRQVQILGPAVANGATSVEVCCLGPETFLLDSLRRAGVLVHALDWTRWFDPRVLWNLRALLREAAPEVVHVWGLPALRTLAVAAADMLPRAVLSDALPAKGKLAWWERSLVRQVRCLALVGDSERERCVRQGVARPPFCIVPPAIEKRCQDPLIKGPDTFFRILCVGRLEREHGFRDAVWAFDFIRYLFPEARLQLVGAGSQRPAIEALAVGLENTAVVQFLGPLAEVASVLHSADVVWIPSLANCGRQTALEAMALGRAVIASDVPCLRELIDDGVTGFLVPAGDVVSLARRTRILLEDAALRARIGVAAREQVDARYPLEQTVETWRQIYRSVAA